MDGGEPSLAAADVGSKRCRPWKNGCSKTAGVAIEAAHCTWHSMVQQMQEMPASPGETARTAVVPVVRWDGVDAESASG